MCVYEKLQSMGVTLPKAPAKGGVYAPVKLFGEKLAYVSGCGPDLDGVLFQKGKLGRDLTLEEGQEAAKCCALNILALIHENIGDLNQVKTIAKTLAFVASEPDFYQQPQVVNGASVFLEEVFGSEVGLGARSAIGTNVLPGNIPVEIELLIELK